MKKSILLVMFMLFAMSIITNAQDSEVALTETEATMCQLVSDLKSGNIESSLDWALETATNYWQDGENNENVSLVQLSISREEAGLGKMFAQYESVGSENFPDFESRIGAETFYDPYTGEEVFPVTNTDETIQTVDLFRGSQGSMGFLTLFNSEMPEISLEHFPVMPEDEAELWVSISPSVVMMDIWFTSESEYGADFIRLYAESFIHSVPETAWEARNNIEGIDYWFWEHAFTLYDGANDKFYIYNWNDAEIAYQLMAFDTLEYGVDPAFGHVVDCE